MREYNQKRLERKVWQWKESDEDTRGVLFTSIWQEVQKMPVVRGEWRRIHSRVASRSPRFASEAEQAMRLAVWRSLKRFDASRGVPFGAYVSRGIKVAMHDFWRQEAWINDLNMRVPVAQYQRYRVAMAKATACGCEVEDLLDDVDLVNACRSAYGECGLSVWGSVDEGVDVEEDDNDAI